MSVPNDRPLTPTEALAVVSKIHRKECLGMVAIYVGTLKAASTLSKLAFYGITVGDAVEILPSFTRETALTIVIFYDALGLLGRRARHYNPDALYAHHDDDILALVAQARQDAVADTPIPPELAALIPTTEQLADQLWAAMTDCCGGVPPVLAAPCAG